METTIKYYIYIRKSTDEEDRQVLSLEAQLTELKEFAEREHLEIVETFIEKKTAKVPGREVFNNLLDKIEAGLPHQFGILAWHTDKLSINFIFAQYTIRRFAVRQNGSAPISFSETDRSPLLCSLINFARTYFGQKPE